MKNTLKYLLVSALLGGSLVSVASLQAAATKAKADDSAAAKATQSTEKGKAVRDWYPFYGTVASIDKQANTISLKKKEGERVLKLDAKSGLEVNGKPATLSDIKVGNYAHGKLHKDSAGKEVITSAKFEKEAPVKKAKGATDKEPQQAPASKSAK